MTEQERARAALDALSKLAMSCEPCNETMDAVRKIRAALEPIELQNYSDLLRQLDTSDENIDWCGENGLHNRAADAIREALTAMAADVPQVNAESVDLEEIKRLIDERLNEAEKNEDLPATSQHWRRAGAYSAAWLIVDNFNITRKQKGEK